MFRAKSTRADKSIHSDKSTRTKKTRARARVRGIVKLLSAFALSITLVLTLAAPLSLYAAEIPREDYGTTVSTNEEYDSSPISVSTGEDAADHEEDSVLTDTNANDLITADIDEPVLVTEETLIEPLDAGIPDGDGTEFSPYLIADIDDLLWMRTQINTAATSNEYRGKYYQMTNDIDMSDVKAWESLSATSATAFTGSFDGNGKTISNLRIAVDSGGKGFFGAINGATIKDLALVNLNITNSNSTGSGVGGIAGTATGNPSTISGCYVSGSVTSDGGGVGGILGTASAGVVIENCRVDGAVKGGYTDNVGGILGVYSGGAANALVIKNSLVTASVEGSGVDGGNVGGIFGNKNNAAGSVSIENVRILSESISFKRGNATIGAVYGSATGTGVLTISNVCAWKGLNLNGVLLKEILYGDPLFSNDRNGATILSWKLTSADGWPTTLTDNSGLWSYAVGKLPVLTRFAGKMPDALPAYMTGYLSSPGSVDRAALTEAIQKAELLLVADYPDAWDDFQVALTRAKIVLGDNESSQAELDAAVQNLADAITLLKQRNALVLAGEGTEVKPYLIADAEQLLKMNRLVNSTDASIRDAYREKFYKLTADIDMAARPWSPIGGNAASTAFTGIFDGNGNAISNLAGSGTASIYMFGYISGATIKNLTLSGDIGGNAPTAGLISNSQAGSVVTDCHVSGTIIGRSFVGGIVGWSVSGGITIEGSSVNGIIKNGADGSSSYFGGMIGRADGGPVLIEDCAVSATILNANNYTGGIVGYFPATVRVTIKNCDVSLSDTGITANQYAGGISGNASNNMTIENCTVIGGTVKGTSTGTAPYVGGLVGFIPNSSVVALTDCYVQTDVESATTYAGGLVGQASTTSAGNVTIERCAYIGFVTGTNFVGGLMGYGTRLTISDCYVDGQINGNNCVGGILGYKVTNGDVSIRNSYTLASVFGNAYVGGILGQQQTATGTLIIADTRMLGQIVAPAGPGAAETIGAISGDAFYDTSAYVQSNTFAWIGMMLGRKTLANMTPADPLFNSNRNGQGFLSWALRSENGWPTAFTDSNGAWFYEPGKLPVLTKFKEKMNNEFPSYTAAIPDSGTVGDKRALQAAIAQAAVLNSVDYTMEAAMWTEVGKKLNFARQVNDVYDISQAEINTAKNSLLDAIAELDRLNAITFDGDGTALSPFEIPDLDRLMKMNRVVNSPNTATANKYKVAYYQLTNNINMSGANWSPLGGIAAATAFTGGFDGGGKTISDLKLSGTTYLGFFGYLNGATIKNLTLADLSIVGTNYIGGIAAYSAGTTTITNCAVSGTITADANVGGITSYLVGTISGCTAEVDISATGMSVGGIAGSIPNSGTNMIEDCSVRGYNPGGAIVSNSTSNTAGTGGIVGSINSGANVATIKDCTVETNIVGLNAGGIVGYGTSTATAAADRIVISGCYFDGMIAPPSATAAANLGGIAGTLLNNFKISDCRSDGTVTMAAAGGGILGRFSGTGTASGSITGCYTTMRIGNGLVAGGIAGTGATTGAGKLAISNSFALNEQVGGDAAANAIHAFGEENVKLDYTTLSTIKVWNGMLIRVNGVVQSLPDETLSYEALRISANWYDDFKNAPWTFTTGKLPVLSSMRDKGGAFPDYMINPAEKQEIADTKALLSLINSAGALVKTAYVAESWDKLAAVLDAAKIVLRNERATQNEIDAVTNTLQAAIAGLELYRENTTLQGDGSAASPYLIGNVSDYEEMTRLLDITGTDIYRTSYYKLTGNIDLQSIPRSPLVYTIATSPSADVVFAGDFDGGGFTIANLSVTHGTGTGLFGYVSDAKIHDLNLENCAITGSSNYTGAIAGRAANTVFENISVKGTVTGRSSTGGIVGLAGGSTMKNCRFEGTVESKGLYWLGGLTGQFGGDIENCSFKGYLTYTGASQLAVTMGGVAGAFSGGNIIGCHVDAEITYKYTTGDSYGNPGGEVGGIVGRFEGNSIIDCHFKGKIAVRGEGTGGIVGFFRSGSSIQGCTSEGEIVMNYPGTNSELHPRPTGGIFGTIETGGGSSGVSEHGVLVDNCTSSMNINGFREAGGIGGTVTGGGSFTISNSQALNNELNNALSDGYVDPFLFWKDWYAGFTGTFTSENNYIWEGMLINGKTIDEWLRQTDNEEKYGDGKGGVEIGPMPTDSTDPGGNEDLEPKDPPENNTDTTPNDPPENNTDITPNDPSNSQSDSSSAGSATVPRSLTLYTAAESINPPLVATANPENAAETTLPEQNVNAQPENISDLDVPTAVSGEARSNNLPAIILIAVIVIAAAALVIRGIRKRRGGAES